MTGARLRAAVWKEFRQLYRDPVLLVLVAWTLTVEVVRCVASVNMEVNKEAIGVLDLDHSTASRELAERFDRTPMFRVRYYPPDERAAAALLKRGEARMVVVVPPGYAERLMSAGGATVQLLADGTNSLLALTATGQAQRLLMTGDGGALTPHDPTTGGPGVENRIRVWYNADMHYVYEHVISMVAISVFMVGLILPAATVAREHERGTLEQVLVTPLRPMELVASKAAPTAVIGILALGPSMLIARAFGVPLRGEIWTAVVLTGALLMSAIAIGILIATLVRTLQQTLLVAFLVLFPVMFLSGTISPIESMPRGLQIVSYLSPLRHYMAALLGVFLKGVGLEVVWPQLLWMLGLGLVLFPLSALLFRRQLA